MTLDYDWIVIGSGFGGSVAALRLTEKGYRVAVLECGRRHEDSDYPATAWNLRRFFWLPSLGMHGILRLSPFRDVLVASGSAVGGGSVVYANTLYRPKPAFYTNVQWAGLDDWELSLDPHYATAERMLGVTPVPSDSDAQQLLKEAAAHLGVAESFTRTPVGVCFGSPGARVGDPYFGGKGPDRTACTRCGACMMGCRVGAKNTLLKNYLWFAERGGATIVPETEVVDITPLANDEGRSGYAITMERPGVWFRRGQRTITAAGVVVAAGSLGSNQLLAQCKLSGSLPQISDRLGHLLRTNSEAIHAVRTSDNRLRPWNDVAISASIHTSKDTHVELVTFGQRADAVSLLLLPIAAGAIRHPLRALRALWPFAWSRKSFFVLVMQTLDNSLAFGARLGWNGRARLSTQQGAARPNPNLIPVAREVTAWLAERTSGIAQASIAEVLSGIPTTAHLLGGVVIGRDSAQGVIDQQHRVFGYQNLLVCDGSAVPANPGVNPALTITAMAERAMTFVPRKRRI